MMDEQDIFEQAGIALRQAAVKGVETFVSNAVGQSVQITGGPAGQVVVGPTNHAGQPAGASIGKILVPLLIGAAVLDFVNHLKE